MRRLSSLILAALVLTPAAAHADDLARLKAEAGRVTIVRDDWGIAHVHGKTDADAVFGMIYAQAEDDFNRVEANYLTALGRTAEAEGEAAIWQDLRQKLYIDPVALKADYARSPAWLKTLMNAWADGLNYYLATHPAVKPRVIKHFEPWMALSFSEGSIGGDIERVSLKDLQAFYGAPQIARAQSAEVDAGSAENCATKQRTGAPLRCSRSGSRSSIAEEPLTFPEPTGSNGMAIAPSNTANHHALLLINPHTSFFFRSELQMTSDQGLNAYGAATWGQFFVYQGFNAKAGWMHTSSGVDAVDEFAETISKAGGKITYRYGSEDRPVTVQTIKVPYRTTDGGTAEKSFTVYKTHHGPIVRAADGKWIAMALMNKPVEALSQSFLRTKADGYKSFLKASEFQANSSNNTIFADAEGAIAYLHPQFIPKRDDRFDYTKVVDGADPATDWKGLTPAAEAPHLLNPANGWIFNTNDWPWSAAGPNSPRREDYPRYMDQAGENYRGAHATLVLKGKTDFTLQSLIAAAYDPYLPGFAQLLPQLFAAYDGMPGADPLKVRLADQIALLRGWDYRWAKDSTATSLAVFWGEALRDEAGRPAEQAGVSVYEYMATRTTAEQKLKALATASDRLQTDFGAWRTPWSRINCFQRVTGDIVQPFTDTGPCTPVAFTSALWGSLASFRAPPHEGTKRFYGTSGNSFVAVVEFGEKVRAYAVTAGGESGDPKSKHFNDQAERYATGNLREVYFYPDQLKGHTERTYKPGQ